MSATYAAVSAAMSRISGVATVTSGAVGEPGCRVQGEGAKHEADEAADREQTVARHGDLEQEQDDREPDEQDARPR